MIASVAFCCPAPSFSSTAHCPRSLPSLKVVGRKAKKPTSRTLERSRRETGGRRRSGVCRAELLHDAPFAFAIGACVLNSLIFPVPAGESEDEEGGGGIDSTDTRFAVMGIISFIPYFNWLVKLLDIVLGSFVMPEMILLNFFFSFSLSSSQSWVFAWMDSGRQRYLVYSIVYLAPYLRSNLSLSPEESWLPIASIFVCILHIQLEVSIKNGDVQSIKFFDEALKPFSQMIKKRDIESKRHQHRPKEDDSKHMKLPSSHGLREKLKEWDNSRKENEELEDERKDKQG
ncbi:hypothetical protein ZIOFF_036406 [Zingiber officinale]|uniref:Uncharacterized protein n=1 Tax=Zingiber officinale TaxID=94328 RepID=A0A8J5GAC5_ZINOF|nr:hypothetical protein ZIOFF_036406 [Zingiber officinale]